MGTFKTQKMAQKRATSCSVVFQVFKLRTNLELTASTKVQGQGWARAWEQKSADAFGDAFESDVVLEASIMVSRGARAGADIRSLLLGVFQLPRLALPVDFKRRARPEFGRASGWPASDHFRHLVTPRDIGLFRQHAAARHQQRSKLMLGQHGLPFEKEFKLGLVVCAHRTNLLQSCLARQQIET